MLDRHLLEEIAENEAVVCEGDQTSLNIAFILSDVDIVAPGSTKSLVKSK